jgi:galactokinase
MFESHESLRDDYEASCPELDALAAFAENFDGV